MCGIIHIKRQNGISASKSVIKRYNKQKTRGTEGFGFIEIKNGVVLGGKRAEEEKDILKALEESTADEILFHHRTPTSTPNFIESTHPIIVKNKKFKYHYYIVHNGIISNDEDMKKSHNKDNFVYTTAIKKQWITKGNTYTSEIWNDSEALAIDFAKSIENNTPMESKGSIAVVALQVDKKTKKAIALYYGRNSGNPLKVENGKDLFGVSSESGKELKANTLYRFDYAKNEITEEKKEIGHHFISYTGYNGYYDGDFEGEDYPAYGHWDETTGQWKNTRRPSFGCGVNYADYEGYDGYYTGSELENDDDHEYEWDEMVDDLEERIAKAHKAGDYDEAFKLEGELDAMEIHFQELKAESRREAKKNKEAGAKARRLGF